MGGSAVDDENLFSSSWSCRFASQGGYSDIGGGGEYGTNGDYGGGDFTGFDQQAANGDVQQQQQANGNGGGFDNGMGFQQDNMVGTCLQPFSLPACLLAYFPPFRKRRTVVAAGSLSV